MSDAPREHDGDPEPETRPDEVEGPETTPMARTDGDPSDEDDDRR